MTGIVFGESPNLCCCEDLFEANNTFMYYKLTAPHGWEWFDGVRNEERYQADVERAQQLHSIIQHNQYLKACRGHTPASGFLLRYRTRKTGDRADSVFFCIFPEISKKYSHKSLYKSEKICYNTVWSILYP